MISRLLLLGATGDLAGRFLLPALAWLSATGGLPDDLRFVGAGAEDWDDGTFRAHVAGRWDAHAGDLPAAARPALLDRLHYRRFDAADPTTVGAAVGAFGDDGPVAVYLALPPALFPPTIEALGSAGLPPGSRIAVEKPFGRDRAGAVALNALLDRVSRGDEGAVTRVDHFLAMPVVEGLTALRTGEDGLEPAWHGGSVARVDVVWEETLGMEGRAGFYDSTGAVRDVLQNHLLQVLVLLAMDLPAGGADDDLSAAKLALLRSLHVASPGDLAACTRRARYTAGTLGGADGAGGRPVPDYVAEDGVDPARGTETHAEIAFAVDTPRWSGTRFVLRTGKGLGTSRKGVAVQLRTAAPERRPRGFRLVAPDRLWLELEGPGTAARSAGLGAAPGELTAYGRVLTDVLTGGRATSVGAAEAEEAWRVVDPVLQGWAAGAVPLLEYPAGSAGPPPLEA